MKYNLKKSILILFILIATFLLGTEQQIPVETITENPVKEVTTVESKKNKESAELNIKVKKRNIEEIEGVDTATGIEFVLPNGSLLENEEIKVVKSLANLPEETSKNKRKKRNLSTIETPSIVIESGDKKIVKIAKEEAENTNYIIKIDKNSNEINKIYKGKTRTSSKVLPYPVHKYYTETTEFVQYSDISYQIISKNIKDMDYFQGLKQLKTVFQQSDIDEYKPKGKVKFDLYTGGYGTKFYFDTTGYASREGTFVFTDLDFYDGGYIYRLERYYNYYDNNYKGYLQYKNFDVTTPKYIYGLETKSYPGMVGTVGDFTISAKIAKITEENLGPWQLIGNLKTKYVPNDVEANVYVEKEIVAINPYTISVNYILPEIGLNKKIPIQTNYNQKLSFYTKNNLDNIKIIENGKVISKDGKASFSKDGTEFDLLFEQKDGEYAKPYIIIKKLTSGFKANNLLVQSLYRGQVVTQYEIKLEFKTSKVGEVELQLDKRIMNNDFGNWVFFNGDIKKVLNGNIVKNLSKLVKVNGNYKNLDSTLIVDGDMRDRTYKTRVGDYKEYSDSDDNAAIPVLGNVKNLEAILVVNSGKSTLLNNQFVLRSERTFYEGNIKETYVGKDAQSGVATLDMSSVSTNEGSRWTRWDTPGATGNVDSTSGSPTVMKFKSGELFNFRSAVEPNGSALDPFGGHIVTKLKVTNNGIVDEIIGLGVNTKLETTKFLKNSIGMESRAGIFITKLADSMTPETYEIEAYYNDILLGKLNLTITNTSEINIGEVVFKVDSRIPKRKLIFSNGDIKNTRDGNVENNYSEFVNLEGNFINLEATEINEVISVEGRPVKNSSFVSSNTARFDVANGTNIDSSYIPLNFNLSSIKDKGLIDNTNSNPLASGMENNIFTLKGANGKFYKGNIKETYVGKDAQSGVATLDMSSVPVIEWSGWNTPGVSGDANSTAGRPTVMKFKSGELFNFRSAAEPTGGHIVTKLKVTNNGIVDEIIGSGVNKRLETSKFNKNKIGITEGGSVFIHKYTEDTNPETYEIEAYYNDILLGKLDLTVVNSEEIDIGKINFEIDKRINKKYGTWIFRTGDTKSSLNDLIPKNNISEFINLDGEFTNLESVNITDVISMENRPVKHATLGGYKVFLIGAGNYNDEGAIPFNINLNTLKEHIVVSLNTSKFLDNIFTLKGANGKFYKGNIKETYVGKDAQSGVATLDMSSVSTNEGSRWTRWDTPGATGNVNSTAGSPTVMKFKSGELFNFRSAVEPNGGHIVTKLKVTNNGIVDEIIGLGVNTKLETTKFLKNIIGIDSGGLFISKKINDTIPETYEIEAYYNEMLLGKLNLTISNSIPIEIGTINYKVDNRFRNYLEIINSKWLNGEGGFSRDKYEWDNGLNADRQYSLLVEKTGDIIMKSRVSSWSQAMGRTLVDGNWGNKSIYSKKYNPSVDGLALPNTKINSGFIETEADFLKYSVFSFVDLSKGMKENNILMYEGIDGKIYVIRMNLEVGNEENGLGKGEIDSIKLKPNETYTFERSKTGEISSFEDSNVKLKLISGTLPRPQSYTSQNIVNKLKVTFNDGGEEIAVGNIYENNKYKIELDQTTGNFKITKKSSDILASDKIKIDYLYNEVKLGEFLLEIKGSKFEIIGDDIIDFGKIIQGKESRIEGNIVVRNLTSQRIVRAELNTLNPLKMLKKDNKTIEMPVNKSILLLDKGTEVPIKIDLKAKPEIDQAIGDYEGELNLYIYIE